MRLTSRLRRVAVAAVATLAAAAAVVLPTKVLNSGGTTPQTSQVVPHQLAPAHCHQSGASYHTVGNEIVGSGGRRFTPSGITIYGLTYSDWQKGSVEDRTHIRDIAKNWCVNTVRIQSAPANLFRTPHSAENRQFARTVKGEFDLAHSLGLNVVLTAQTENFGQREGGFAQTAPTELTLRYWEALGHALRSENRLMFDIFNEPRLFAATPQETWKLWKNGGKVRGGTYLGMQQLVQGIRAAGINRILWVEGPWWSGTFDELGSHQIHGRDLVYALHHPRGPHNATVWNVDFGNVSHHLPVVIGEWSQYASATNGSCWADGYHQVPAFLKYLRTHNIGLIVWALKPGVLIDGHGHLTAMPPDYRCSPGSSEGGGQVIHRYFNSLG